MRVFRIEDDDGNGPFRYNHIIDAMGTYVVHTTDNGFPTPQEEGLNFTSCHKCGCLSPRELVRWFPRPVREILAREGYSLAIYEVPESQVQIGEHQVIYVST